MSFLNQYTFILDENKAPIACDDLIAWMKWIQQNNRRIARTEIDEILVSTVFIGWDYNYCDGEPPIVFETLVFLPEGATGSLWRYTTWDEAVAGHEQMVKEVQAYLESADDHANSLLGHLRALIK